MTDMHLALVRALIAPENLAVIERDLREQIAREIEALPPENATGSRDFGRGYASAVRDAARITRGD